MAAKSLKLVSYYSKEGAVQQSNAVKGAKDGPNFTRTFFVPFWCITA